MFTGFKTLVYPEYSVILPQSGKSYNVRCLNVAEVAKLKTSVLTSAQIPKVISEISYDVIVNKDYQTYDEFIAATTILDRESILYGIYCSTFGDVRDITTECVKCGEEYKTSVNFSEILSLNSYPYSESVKNDYLMQKAMDNNIHDKEMEEIIKKDAEKIKRQSSKIKFVEDEESPVEESHNPKKTRKKKTTKKEVPITILDKRVTFELVSSKNITCTLKQPTIYDEINFNSSNSFISNDMAALASNTLFIERFEEIDDNGQRLLFLDNSVDIFSAYQTLTKDDKAKIFDMYEKEFGCYCISLETQCVCTRCGEVDKMQLNIAKNFFQEIIRE